MGSVCRTKGGDGVMEVLAIFLAVIAMVVGGLGLANVIYYVITKAMKRR